MYLSRLVLNPRSWAVRRDLADCYEQHRTVMSAFGDLPTADGDARTQLGVLYRVDADRRTERMTLLVQSRAAPRWSALPGDYVLAPAASKPVDGAFAAIGTGDRLTFRLRANPTKRISKANPEEKDPYWHGRRVNLRDEEAWLKWLARKGEQGGFRLVAVAARDDVAAVRAADQGKVRSGTPRAKKALTFASVLFDGHLEVADPDRFRESLAQGIGSGKAFGFGLLSVAPAR